MPTNEKRLTIALDVATLKKLNKIKILLGYKQNSKVIKLLIKEYNPLI